MMYHVYTDGSCNNHKPKPERAGGWAFAINSESVEVRKSGRVDSHSTSQQMELCAVEQALIYMADTLTLQPEDHIIIYSDSAYVVNCFKEKWYERWVRENFVLTKNADYWRTILVYRDAITEFIKKLEFVKVKGHSGVVLNELVDKLAGEARLNIRILS